MKYDVTIIYVYYNTPQELLKSVSSVFSTARKLKVQIVIVDNNSPKKIPRRLLGMQNIQIVKNENTGYGAGLNKGVRYATSKKLIFVNPDVIFFEGSLHSLVEKLDKNNIGIVGPQMLDVGGNVLPTISGRADMLPILIVTTFLKRILSKTSIYKNFLLPNLDRSKEHAVSVVSGACMAIKREVFEQVGGFDENFFMYFEENDLCERVRGMGLTIVYYPKAKIFHAVGASSSDSEAIEKRFSESRFKYIKKYNPIWKAILAELFLRLTTVSGSIIFLSLCLSLFLNLYNINTHMLFIGDFGRDYLAARDMLITGNIPLVGIPSSVVWLHQGPLSIYFIGFSLLVSNFNPIAPAIFYALLGTLSVYMLYLLARSWFGSRVASFSALIFATSPLIVISSRMPYHTSSMPFFVIILFLALTHLIKGKSNLLHVVSFVLGILLLLELSNAVLIVVLGAVFLLKKPLVNRKHIAITIGSFLTAISPFILYDLTNNFVQTVGLPLWIVNRVRLFFGLASPEKVTTGSLPQAFERIYQQLTGIIYPENQLVVFISLLLFVLFLFSMRLTIIKFRKLAGIHLLLMWLFIPLLGFLVHAAPGTAYFPLLFPAIAICMGLSVFYLYRRFKIAFVLLVVLCIFNAFFLVSKNYYLRTEKDLGGLPPFDYKFGLVYSAQEEAAKAIVLDSKGADFSLNGGGMLGQLVTGIDNYSYLVWYYGGNIVDDSELSYTIYEDKQSIINSKNVIFDNSLVFIERDDDE